MQWTLSRLVTAGELWRHGLQLQLVRVTMYTFGGLITASAVDSISVGYSWWIRTTWTSASPMFEGEGQLGSSLQRSHGTSRSTSRTLTEGQSWMNWDWSMGWQGEFSLPAPQIQRSSLPGRLCDSTTCIRWRGEMIVLGSQRLIECMLVMTEQLPNKNWLGK